MTRARVREVDGRLVLDDPDALAMVRVVALYNCRQTFEAQGDRVQHFAGRIGNLNLSPKTTMVVLINVDTDVGASLAEALMPGTDWQAFRDRGEVPFARGLVMREGIQDTLDEVDPEAGKKLRELTQGVAVLVVDHGVADVFAASELPKAALTKEPVR